LNEGYIMPERIEFMPCEFILSLSRTRAHTHININIYYVPKNLVTEYSGMLCCYLHIPHQPCV